MQRYNWTYITTRNLWDFDGNINNAIKALVNICIENPGYEKIYLETESDGIDFFGLTPMTEEEYQAEVRALAEAQESKDRATLKRLVEKYGLPDA